ncbi:MAG: hypothetical protein HC889_00660 [Synechococcaceae cyanobacterium SM1_2_3]|nr:hypothetical protein [Synechococcaceae cyanobacterium SM1_2_3]
MSAPITGKAEKLLHTGPQAGQVGLARGFATVGSGQVHGFISSSLITSGVLLHLTFQAGSFGAIASNSGNIEITSITDGVGARLSCLTGVARQWDTTVHWQIMETA